MRKIDVYGTGSSVSSILMTSVTDPAVNAAVTTAIVDTYGGVIVTLTGAGNAQTISSPTITTPGKVFTVVNNDTSGAFTITVNGFTITAGEAQSFIWDGSAWGPIDIGITSIPVPVVQGGTGKSVYVVGDILYADTTTTLAARAAVASGSIFASAGVGVAPVWTVNPSIGSESAGGNLSVVATLGSNIVTNGTFTTDLTGWAGANWAQSAGTALHTAGATTALTQAAATVTSGTTYKLTFDVVGGSVGTVTCSAGGVTMTNRAFGSATYTEYFTATATTALAFTPTTTFDGAIDNVVLKALTDATGDLTVDGNATFRSPIIGDVQLVFRPKVDSNLAFQVQNVAGSISAIVVDTANNRLGIGTIPQGTVHIFQGSAAAAGLPSALSAMIIENSGGVGFSMVSPDNSYKQINFTNPTNVVGYDGIISYGGPSVTSVINRRAFAFYTAFNNDGPDMMISSSGAALFGVIDDTDYNYFKITPATIAGTSHTLSAETGGSGADNVDIILAPAGTGVVKTTNIYPSANDTYYLGKNSSTSPLAWKGLIVKDTTDGNLYRIETAGGLIQATLIP